jgi:outer membrane lipoprotein-sorting protein
LKKSLSTLVLSLFVAAAAHAQTADEIIAANTKAKGGLEKMKAMSSIKMSGKMSMGPIEAPFTIQKARPENVRMDFTIQGMTGTQAYDGKTGWMLMPFAGKTTPEKLSEDMLKDIVDEADFDGPMIDYKAKGHKVEYLGKEELEGTPVHKLKMTKKNGDESIIYIDADSSLEIKMTSKRKVQGQEVEFETTIGDYKEVEGFMMPFSVSSKAKGVQGMGQSITLEKIEVNPKLDPVMFKMPEVKAEPKPEAKKN